MNSSSANQELTLYSLLLVLDRLDSCGKYKQIVELMEIDQEFEFSVGILIERFLRHLMGDRPPLFRG